MAWELRDETKTCFDDHNHVSQEEEAFKLKRKLEVLNHINVM